MLRASKYYRRQGYGSLLRPTCACLASTKIVIVESPNKVSNIGNYIRSIGSDLSFDKPEFKQLLDGQSGTSDVRVSVMATVGHFQRMDGMKQSVVANKMIDKDFEARPEELGLAEQIQQLHEAQQKKGKKASGAGGKKGAEKKKEQAAAAAASQGSAETPNAPTQTELRKFTVAWKAEKHRISPINDAVKNALASGRTVEVIVATDPDREGELIGHHALSEVLAAAKKQSKAAPGRGKFCYSRAYIQAVTEDGVRKAMQERRVDFIDKHLSEAAEARHCLDRIFGFCGSSCTRCVNRDFNSVGRVQTPSLILLRDRELEIEAFAQKYGTESSYTLSLMVELSSSSSAAPVQVPANIMTYEGKRASDGLIFKTKEMAEEFVSQHVVGIDNVCGIAGTFTSTDYSARPPKPLTMQSLISLASRAHRMSSSDVAACTQWLFQEGLISYPRTDSERLEDAYVAKVTELIKAQYGQEFVASAQGDTSTSGAGKKEDGAGKKKRAKKAEDSNIEGAHEAIHPTNLDFSAVVAKARWSGTAPANALSVYKLIYKTTVTAFMTPRKSEVISQSFCGTTTAAGADSEGDVVTFSVSASKVVHAGFRNFSFTSSSSSSDSNTAVEEDDEDDAAAAAAAEHGGAEVYDALKKIVAAIGGGKGSAKGTTATETAKKRGGAKKKGDTKSKNKSDADGDDVVATAVTAIDAADKTAIKPPHNVTVAAILPKEKKLRPPRLYSEGTLIETLKNHGVGRPSTYPTIVGKLRHHGYISINRQTNRISVSSIGTKLVHVAQRCFPLIVDIRFTAKFEHQLDLVSRHSMTKDELLSRFVFNFADGLTKCAETLRLEENKEKSEEQLKEETPRPIHHFIKYVGKVEQVDDWSNSAKTFVQAYMRPLVRFALGGGGTSV